MSVTAFFLNERRFEPRLWLITEGLVDLKDIKAIIDLMKKNSISEFELERQDFKIRLKRGLNGGPVPVQYEDASGAAVAPPAVGVLSTVAPAALAAPPGTPGELEIKSP